VGTVAAVGAMLDSADDGRVDGATVATVARILGGEGERLEELLGLFRHATADPFGDDAGAEPLHVPELLAEVAAIAGYALPDASVRIEAAPDVPPAVAPRAALVQALLVTVVAGTGGTITLRAAGDGDAVRVLVAGAVGDGAAAAAGAAAWLLGAADGEVSAGHDGVTLRLRALRAPARRRAEG
jgi:hypothetical protein